jgi:two-component system, chemotaxis family, chemotaxis protein CheY
MAKILVVDDSVTMRQMVSFTLEKAGHTVLIADSGISALKLTDKERFDLVITDINMPGMSGLELIKELRMRQAMRTKPILVLTTEADAEKKAAGRAAGATGWLVKPFDPSTLLEVLPRVLPKE